MKIREQYTCPLEITQDIIKGKWKPVILFQLYYMRRASLSKLQASIKGISQKMLIEQLKELQEFDLVTKKTFEGYPLRVEYSITKDKGKKIMQALKILQELGNEYISENLK